MKDLFRNAKFGDEFVRRDGKIARYCGIYMTSGFDIDHVLECGGVVNIFDDNGMIISWQKSKEDIVSRKEGGEG